MLTKPNLQQYNSTFNMEEVDKEIQDLVKKLNQIDGISTTESCFGHGVAPVRVWLYLDINRIQPILFYFFNNGFYLFRFILETADVRLHQQGVLYCRLESKHIGIEAENRDIPALIQRIDKHIEDYKNFLKTGIY